MENIVAETKFASREAEMFPKAGFPLLLLANIFVRSDFFPLSLSFRLKQSGTN